MKESKLEIIRYVIKVYGLVQGVGFRPFVYNKAHDFELHGYVSNNGAGVVIDVEGTLLGAKSFIKELVKSLPLLAKIEKIEIRKADLNNYRDFEIKSSSSADEDLRFILRDVAICDKCRKDVLGKDGRWAGYAFTNCTDCGPRYSIIKELPYDRCNTTMEAFQMCESCRQEYENPAGRRFHAQPVCCDDCGPQLKLLDSYGNELVTENALKAAADFLKVGKIVAVKGIGGFHLMCDAENYEAICSLRNRKKRPHRSLAVMTANIDKVNQQCTMNEQEKQLVSSNQTPIVLLRKNANCNLPDIIAPDTDRLGMMLPYTPIHVLLFEEGLNYLIVTSGNISGMPIEYKNDKAVISLSGIADYFLINDRDINIPLDDSVTKAFRGKEMLSRIGRGYAPLTFNIGCHKQIIALGAEQKSSICISQKGYAHISQYLGDIKRPEAYESYKKVLDNLKNLMKLKPETYVHDLHPYYLTTQYALEQPEEKLAIQHHFAHMASCIAEHKLSKPVIGIIYDGTGFGEDGKNWGGEILVGTLAGFNRAGHWKYCSIQGGDRAAIEPWRSAISYLQSAGYDLDCFPGIDKSTYITVKAAIQSGLNCYESSSVGRLFDGVSALLGLCNSITYDAQAAIRLENIMDRQVQDSYGYIIYEDKGCVLIDYQEIIGGVLRDKIKGKSITEISGKFHNAIAAATTEAVIKISCLYGISEVLLGGGCFENLMLMERVHNLLEVHGFKVYFNEKLPCNDGGISFGQLAAADQILRG